MRLCIAVIGLSIAAIPLLLCCCFFSAIDWLLEHGDFDRGEQEARRKKP